MTTAQAGARGYPPTLKIEKAPEIKPVDDLTESELDRLYEDTWEMPAYRRRSPGEKIVGLFWDFATTEKGVPPYKTQTVIDWGCGTGRAGYELYKKGLDVTLIDFAKNSLDENIAEEAENNDRLRFVVGDLTKPLDIEKPSQYGFCTDVLEHIPEEDIDACLDNILANSKHVFFQIACFSDVWPIERDGVVEEVEMHLCIHDYKWWLQKLVEKDCIIHTSKDTLRHCIFYVTNRKAIDLEFIEGSVNVSEDRLIENIKANSKIGLDQIRPYPVQDTEIMLLAGGPSLNEFEEEIIQNRKDGMKLITVNNTYNWAMERGLKPSLQFLIDARGFNKRFTEQSELTDETKFIIASSADPESLELLPKDRTLLFHTTLSDEVLESIVESYGDLYKYAFPVPGGCTVTLRAIAALRLLGFFKIHVYGFDSCLADDGSHHAYSQPENDDDTDRAVPIIVAGGSDYERRFMCAPWMAMQAAYAGSRL
jgi:SAM-dependent methyltransferase